MNCLTQRKKFKNKHPVWSDPVDKLGKEPEETNEDEDVEKNSEGLQGVDSSDSSSEDDEMYANDVRSKKISLESKELQFKQLTCINNDRSFKGVIKRVQFNPKSKMALVSLSYGQADLYEVDGERNRYIQNIKLPSTKEPYCSFKPDGDSIVISSEGYKGTFFTYDMVSASINKYALKIGNNTRDITDFTIFGDYMACRKEGSQEIIVLSSKTYENVFSLKINEPAKAVLFTGNNEIFIAGENARVYIWDLRKTSLCKFRFQDEGSVHTTSMAISDSAKALSLGSDSGIVNSYDLDQCLKNRFPVPSKTFSNLKTPVDILKYNSSGELLFMASSQEQKSFRIIHSHSGTVYKNFPPPGKTYGHLLSVDFSPLGGYLSLGCSSGRAYLYRLPYYKSY